MPRKEFVFFIIFEELFVFVVDPPVNSPMGSRDSPVYSSRGVVTPRCIHHRGVKTLWGWIHRGIDQDWFTKNLLVQKTPGSQDSSVNNTRRVFTPWFICHYKVFFKPILMRVPNPARSWLPGVFNIGALRLSVYSPQGSRDSLVYSSLGSHFRHRGVVLKISLHGVFITGESTTNTNNYEYSEKFEIVSGRAYLGRRSCMTKKNRRWKISWHCPFKLFQANR